MISMEELEVALLQSGPNKALGPDGITVEVIRILWDSVKDKLLLTFQKFFSQGILPKGLNYAFIALIPKVDSPSLVTDFRPISLINTSLNLLSKSLCNRLDSVMPNLIGINQEMDIHNFSYMFKDILALRNNPIAHIIFKIDNYIWIVGNGKTVLFWEDIWTGCTPLYVRFSRLYSISKWQLATLDQVKAQWDVNTVNSNMWTRPLRGWEDGVAQELKTLLESTILRPREDIL
ncbi:hypothetical protein POM88_002527 [Heracleum sosnowskyi]|uniref:Reverse transcriptase domain-containing protein n=1 Tax=Heracleum sosnowskyi TaxID=360622 RepID=A0AAD8JEK2_9APIA|nr:hypothetical protein POM88_002527 [Heracleum sosnowskyi]